jgi:hypothetical protein
MALERRCSREVLFNSRRAGQAGMTGGEVFALEQVFRLRPFLFHRSLRARRDDYHRRMIPASLLFVALSMSLPAASGTSAVAATGEQTSVMFTACSPFSRSTELVRRLLSPLNAWRVLEVSRRAGHALREQPLDAGQQRFSLYVPRHAPPGGYALLVFVPPWNSKKAGLVIGLMGPAANLVPGKIRVQVQHRGIRASGRPGASKQAGSKAKETEAIE